MSLISIIGTPLYQWETGRKLKIIPLRGMRVDSVHISNYGDKTALVVKPREENGAYIADIPNILLQDDRSISVYSVNVSEDKTETLRECVFSIQKRAKPSDYIYTETEVFTYKALEARVAKLEEDPTGGGSVPDGQARELIGDLANLNTKGKGNLVDAINEALQLGYADVTEAYNVALSEGTVTCAREYLWTLGEGRWSLVDGDEKYYLQVFLGDLSAEPTNQPKRILIRCWEFIDIEIYTGGDRYDREPDIRLDGETCEMFRCGELCNPTDISLAEGKLYLSNAGQRFGKGVELPKSITEERVIQMIDEAFGGLLDGKY